AMRVLVTGSPERFSRLEPKLKGAGWEALHAHEPDALEALADEGALAELDAVAILPGDLVAFQSENLTEQLLEFLEHGLLSRLRTLVAVTKAVRARGRCRFVLVAGNLPPTRVPDDPAARARVMAAAGRAAAIDGGQGCTAK